MFERLFYLASKHQRSLQFASDSEEDSPFSRMAVAGNHLLHLLLRISLTKTVFYIYPMRNPTLYNEGSVGIPGG